jgi:hypothetical protein
MPAPRVGYLARLMGSAHFRKHGRLIGHRVMGTKEEAASPRALRPIHHSPLFWVGAAMFMLAILTYVFSEDLSLRLGSFDSFADEKAAHMVAALCHADQIVLGHLMV